MVLHDFEQIKKDFPEILHTALFLGNGMVMETTLSHEQVNIPVLGKKLVEMIDRMQDLLETSGFHNKVFQKIIFEVEDVVIIVLKLKEGDNLALFFEGRKFFEKYGPTFRQFLANLERTILKYDKISPE
ncbi:MAG: hypothetical protein RBG13Loki_1951 [Promethearchaeota archaeon CR_4]|nr:MAG: hypothetical protein RBG13Loki_1951 [Candidatus Lokiarchaeota archaeon CR_4]